MAIRQLQFFLFSFPTKVNGYYHRIDFGGSTSPVRNHSERIGQIRTDKGFRPFQTTWLELLNGKKNLNPNELQPYLHVGMHPEASRSHRERRRYPSAWNGQLESREIFFEPLFLLPYQRGDPGLVNVLLGERNEQLGF